LHNDVKIGGGNIVIEFRLLGPETSDVRKINEKTVAKIHMRHSQTTHACIFGIGHDQVDGELPPLAPILPAGFVAELIGAAGAISPVTGVLEEYT
jgi:hypothetical protein